MLVHRYLLNDQSPYENDSSHPSLNSNTTKEAILHLSYSVILLNLSNEVVQSVAFESERAETRLNNSISRSKREEKLADATKNTRFSPPLSGYIQLLPPHKALVYAKKEIDNAPLVNEDLDLYASLFRNISIFKSTYIFILHEGLIAGGMDNFELSFDYIVDMNPTQARAR
ncbi:hypothetical protein Ahy_A02g005410 [Arachis hypogaea]|uniref:Uncharacterized protein n=1 Tax=Arachis hypogaea TaxID=3818 RepID=A0A445E6J7_ARAHY|nr:hypothetical protein Ahy_A02g005410 [Arachis hypogaea]